MEVIFIKVFKNMCCLVDDHRCCLANFSLSCVQLLHKLMQ